METHSVEEARERAALYAVGALVPQEREDFEAHLDAGCDLCRAEVDAFTAVTSHLGQASEMREPRGDLRRLVLEAVDRAATESPIFDEAGLRFVRTARMAWESRQEGAIDTKPLFTDAQRGYQSRLVRMAPGSEYPDHRHVDVEELYLLDGDLTVSGVVMHAGDYCRAETGTIHTGISTQRGCTFVVFGSDRNEILA